MTAFLLNIIEQLLLHDVMCLVQVMEFIITTKISFSYKFYRSLELVTFSNMVELSFHFSIDCDEKWNHEHIIFRLKIIL